MYPNPKYIKALKGTDYQRQSTPLKTQFELLSAIPWATLWNIVLTVGGLQMVVFFSSIEYFPDLTWKDLAVVVSSIAILSIFLTTGIGLSITLPSIYLKSQSTRDRPYVFFEAVFGILYLYILVLSLAYLHEYEYISYISSLCAVALLCLMIWAEISESPKFQFLKFTSKIKRVLFWGVWALIPMMFYEALTVENGANKLRESIMPIAYATLFAIISIYIGLEQWKNTALAYCIGIVGSAYLLGGLSGRPTFISLASMRAFGLSMPDTPVRIVLTKSGCEIINASLNQGTCIPDASANFGVINGARIDSRIGSQMVIRWHDSLSRNTVAMPTSDAKMADWQRVVIDKKEIASWTYIRKSK